jgi:hypothetical protein
MDFLASLGRGTVVPLGDDDLDYILDATEANACTVDEMKADRHRHLAARRSFYETVRGFVSDPATW